MFHPWRVLRQMRNGNGWHFLHKLKMKPIIVLNTLLRNIVVWRYSYSNGKFGSLPFFFLLLLRVLICYLIFSFSICLVSILLNQLSSTWRGHTSLWMKWAITMFRLLSHLSGQWSIGRDYLFSPCFMDGNMEKKKTFTSYIFRALSQHKWLHHHLF